MPSSLQAENYSLRQQLESLLAEARRNEDKMRRFDQLERRLIGAGSLAELLRMLLVDYKAAFGIESVSLALFDPEYEATRILEAVGMEPLAGLFLLQSPGIVQAAFGDHGGTVLSSYDSARHAPLFGDAAGELASVALLPLRRGDDLIGSLNLGSATAARYEAGFGTDFLDRLSGIVAVCIESALAQERLKRVGLTDALTGVQNRRYFEHRCQVEISQSLRHRQPLACMFLDVDKFKRINDTWGHQTGDDVLRGVAETIQAQLRAGDTIARYGGEEFVVLLPQTAGCHAREIAERIRQAVAAQAFPAQQGGIVPVTISIGLSMLAFGMPTSDSAEHAAQLVAAADKALYQAKHTGRNRVVCDREPQGDECADSSGSLVGAWLNRLFGRLAAAFTRRSPARA